MAEKPNTSKERLIVALLAETMKDAEGMVKLLKQDVHTFEVGAPTYTALGPDVIKMIRSHGCRRTAAGAAGNAIQIPGIMSWAKTGIFG